MATKQGTENALIIERTFDAPRELVFKAWTEPERVLHWLGPKAFTSPAATIDFRVGGKFLFAMQSPEFNDGRRGEHRAAVHQASPARSAAGTHRAGAIR